ncbi:MAG: hypothetical protein LBE18_00490 [Planctomycetaceae bacterium]|jgi:hypothetical protein|nr:hypothetical protein [Planctomycetaceae bacterium]
MRPITLTFLFTSAILYFAALTAEIYSETQNIHNFDQAANTDFIVIDDDNSSNDSADSADSADPADIADSVNSTDSVDPADNNKNKDDNTAKQFTYPSPKIICRELDNWLKASSFADDSVRQNVLSLWNDAILENENEQHINEHNEHNEHRVEVVERLPYVASDDNNVNDVNNVNDAINSIEKKFVESISNLDLFKPTSAKLFDLSIESMRRASNQVAEYLKICDKLAWEGLPYGQKLVIPQVPIHIHLGESNVTQYLYNSLRMYLALKLVQGRFYSEAIKILEEIQPANCINPAELFITRAALYNALSQNEEGLEAIKDFRESEKTGIVISRRHKELAKLLEFEMNDGKEDDSPQNISKKMDNARRILGKGDPGKEAQETEEDILKSLEKLIEKIEQQAKESQQNKGNSKGDSLQSNNPAEDSDIARGKAPGNVDRKDFEKGTWGNLPPKEREAALSKIERDFPSHYRDIIESYFREMANSDGKD